jgi:hypothetical protein
LNERRCECVNVMPEYNHNIIVGVVWRGEWQWYVTEKEMWVLDYIKWGQSYADAGFGHMAPDDAADRFGIPVVNEVSAGHFLECIRDCRTNSEELGLLLEAALMSDPEDLTELAPTLMVDFDRQVLVSWHPEPMSFERYVPDRWIGEYRAFLREVPKEERYWILDGTDWFDPAATDRQERIRRLRKTNVACGSAVPRWPAY